MGLMTTACTAPWPELPPTQGAPMIHVHTNRSDALFSVNGVPIENRGQIYSFTPAPEDRQVTIAVRFAECESPIGPARMPMPTRQTVVGLPLRGDFEVHWMIDSSECVPLIKDNPAFQRHRGNPAPP
ncbi:hypothetical protein [Phaeospirillum tilakii]|uniref:Lipoprotein n=1 Tax=Phaeospirillum tilakii TaxID=741673 RepID=A0ABW5C8M8_9PROT